MSLIDLSRLAVAVAMAMITLALIIFCLWIGEWAGAILMAGPSCM